MWLPRILNQLLLGLFEYVQLFVISNGTFTKYYSNTTGSGKTLTSFKTAQIASKLPFIDKVTVDLKHGLVCSPIVQNLRNNAL